MDSVRAGSGQPAPSGSQARRNERGDRMSGLKVVMLQVRVTPAGCERIRALAEAESLGVSTCARRVVL